MMVLFYLECSEFEVMPACEILNSEFVVDAVTPDGNDHFGSNRRTFRASEPLSAFNVSDY